MRLNTSLINRTLTGRDQVEFSYSQPSPPYSSLAFNQIRRDAMNQGNKQRINAKKSLREIDKKIDDKDKHLLTQQRIRSRMIIRK